MNYSEAVAVGIVEALLPGAVMQYQPYQSNGEHDFNLIQKNGQIVPLEITISTNESHKGTVKAIRNVRKGGPFVKANLCHQSWYVFPAPDVNVNNIRKHIDAYLAEIEAEGRNYFNSYTDAYQSSVIERIFRDLRIEAGEVIKWKQPRQIGIALPKQRTRLNAEHLEQAVEAEAYKSDNREKLGRVISSNERHLFVYIEHDNFPAWYAINGTSPSLKLPSLPIEITHVWAVASSREPDKYVVWRASVSEHWVDNGIVILTPDQLKDIRDRIG